MNPKGQAFVVYFVGITIVKALISGFAAFVTRTIVVYPRKRISICRDPADNMLLECCLESKADILISSDRDLLDIKILPFDLNDTDSEEILRAEIKIGAGTNTRWWGRTRVSD
jgi:predicted nucleic acid-binding protein